MSKNSTSRLRMFAGPNGSGKSTIFHSIKRMLHIDLFINADEIEKEFNDSGFINLYDFGIKPMESNWQEFLKNSTLVSKIKSTGIEIQLSLKNNIIVHQTKRSFSYEAALVAEFLRLQLIQTNRSFSFETVMSHSSKVDILDFSMQNDFRNYLYFICTESPLINKERVRLRVEKGGHPVPLEKVEERYFRSLDLLALAVKRTYKSFIFDNSGSEQKLIAEVYQGKKITIHNDSVPNWVNRHLFEKLI